MLSQRLGDWISRAPELEEDVALANIALDLLGHARSLLHYAGTRDGRSEDDLAYFRDEPDFRNAWLFEQPNGDFAHTIARQLFVATYLVELYRHLEESTDATLAAIAAKSSKEVDYHRDHAIQWTLRLAGGTDESRRRMIRAVEQTWPYVDELFRDDELVERLAAEGSPLPSSLRPAFDEVIDAVFAEAELSLGREGRLAFVVGGRGREGHAHRAPRPDARRDAGARPRPPRERRGDPRCAGRGARSAVSRPPEGCRPPPCHPTPPRVPRGMSPRP